MKSTLHVAEPPPRYLARPPSVVDCSVVAGALFQEHWRDAAQERLVSCELHAPFLLQAEFANVALKKMRQGFVDLAQDALAQLSLIAIKLHRVNEIEVVSLAQAYDISAYDACYLWLAAELGSPLATFDDRLATAARAHLGGL
jgi:predicted nucleic acid-binding protein